MSKLHNIVMFAASQGGHYKELMGLRNLFSKYDSVLVTDNLGASKQEEIISQFSSVAFPVFRNGTPISAVC